MKLYLIEQKEITGYDTFDSAVVCAKSSQAARRINPGTWGDTWASNPSKVRVKYLGAATKTMEEGLILSSFNAG